MALTVRQVGQVAPPLKQKIEEFQQVIDNNDQIVSRIREQVLRVRPERERLAASVKQREDDRRNLDSSLARLEDALASFGAESSQLEGTIEEVPRVLERVMLPASPPGGFGGAGDVLMQARQLPAATIDVPLPYFETLAGQLEERAQGVWERVNDMERALTAYGRRAPHAPVAGQIEAVVRSEHAQFRALCAQVAQAADRLERLREGAIRARGVPPGMLARLVDVPAAGGPRPQQPGTGAGLLAGPLGGGALALAVPGLLGQAPAGGALMGGGLFGAGMFGQTSGGGLFGAQPASGGLFGAQPTSGGGLFGAPAATGGGLFGAAPAAGGGLFGAPAATGGGLFGAPAATSGGGLFGAAPAGGGLFGAAPASGGGLFGAAPAAGGGLFGGGGGLFGK